MTKDDPDRNAILARRQHFIALALSGLATTACTSGGVGNKDGAGDSAKGEEQQPPQPCLSIKAPEVPPQACLEVAAPDPVGETEGGSETGAEETEDKRETGAGETGASEPAPRPCLKQVAPKPCLRKAAPKPCLKKVAPEPSLEDDPGFE